MSSDVHVPYAKGTEHQHVRLFEAIGGNMERNRLCSWCRCYIRLTERVLSDGHYVYHEACYEDSPHGQMEHYPARLHQPLEANDDSLSARTDKEARR